MMTMALRLDAICAKLKLNIATSESGIFKSENNNDSESISNHLTLTLAAEEEEEDADKKKQLSADGRIRFSDKAVASAAFASSFPAVGQRSRRKNFQPRCVQEVSSKEIPGEKLDSAEDKECDGSGEMDMYSDLQVLDLRMANTSHEQQKESTRKYSNDAAAAAAADLSVYECGVIDLSVRCKTDDMRRWTSVAERSESGRRDGRSEVVKLNFKTNHQNNRKDVSPTDGREVNCSVDEDLSMNHFALHSMNKLLKIYGLEEQEEEEEEEEGEEEKGGDGDFHSDVRCLPLPSSSSSSSSSLLWNSELANARSVQGKCNVVASSSAVAEPHPLPVSRDSDLQLTKKSSLASSSNQSTDAGASFDGNSSSLPGLLVKKFDRNLFIPSLVGFSSKQSKRSDLKHYSSTTDYSRYAKRFDSYEECSDASCREKSYKEHFHCTACTKRVYLKKEEMIRHFKWHKKREDSLQHGFMRYSPLDDCSKRFSIHCNHNGKHTHYHCLQSGCSKVYISTSDVQMHANYHRKDSAIIQEGFQRFRATENCAMTSCAFADQKTTHFHCRRQGCNFTFKNKADMEKHKTYHQKDEMLTRDGFKKFMKYEQCQFIGCHYSRVSNHIHCIRPDCNYVLHSTGQLYSHKRRHERREIEQSAYRQQLVSSSLTDVSAGLSSASESLLSAAGVATVEPTTIKSTVGKQDLGICIPGNIVKPIDFGSGDAVQLLRTELMSNGRRKVEVKKELSDEKEEEEEEDEKCFLSPGLVKFASNLVGKDFGDSLNLPIPFTPLPEANGASDVDDKAEELSSVTAPNFMTSVFFRQKTLPLVNEKKERDESWKRYLTRYTANDPCHAQCQFLYKDHYHCNQTDCTWLFRSKDGVREHAKFHEQQDRITALTFMKYESDTKCLEGCEHSEKLLHYHCLWTNCGHVISSKDSVFSRLEHHKFHDSFGRKTTGFNCGSAVDGLKRKRGRPPKFPKNDIPVIPKVEMTEEQMFTQAELSGSNSSIANGFKKYEDGQLCADDKCVYAHKEHYHCVRPRCHHVTDRSDALALHAKDFHGFIVIAEGFEFFDRNVNCRRPHCHNNQSNRHFHCVRPNCDYSFVRYSTMAHHSHKHRAEGGSQVTAKASSKFNTSPSVGSSSGFVSASVAKATVDGRGSLTKATRSTATLFPVSSLVAQPSVLLSSTSVGLTPLLVTSLQPMSSYSIAPIIVGPFKQGIKGHDLRLTSPPLKLVSIAPKPSTVLKFQAPVSGDGIEIEGKGVASAVPPCTTATPSPSASEAPLTVLLQQRTSAVPSVDWVSMKLKMHHKVHQNCGRPFCKLKKKDHYHCFDCNQAFSDPTRLESHVARHGVTLETAQATRNGRETSGGGGRGGGGEEPDTTRRREDNAPVGEGEVAASGGEEDEEEEEDEGSEASVGHQSFVHSLAEIPSEDRNNRSEEIVGDLLGESDDADVGRLVIDFSSVRSGCGGTSSIKGSGSDGVSLDPLLEGGSSSVKKSYQKREFDDGTCIAGDQKKPKIASGGYEKFRFSEDCCQDRCAYRLSMTHYHCSRPDCGYSFCDHSRFLQHSDRHGRIDVIMGDQFRHFHAKTDCRHPGCEHARNSTHFHCLICSYVCTDSSKVVAHRKHHSKMERITDNGFQKFGVGENCDFSVCVHRFKQTHYHCSHLDCGHVVMGPAQMALHKTKHHNDTAGAAAAAATISTCTE